MERLTVPSLTVLILTNLVLKHQCQALSLVNVIVGDKCNMGSENK